MVVASVVVVITRRCLVPSGTIPDQSHAIANTRRDLVATRQKDMAVTSAIPVRGNTWLLRRSGTASALATHDGICVGQQRTGHGHGSSKVSPSESSVVHGDADFTIYRCEAALSHLSYQ